jgi:hypothetical protein
VAGVLSRGTRVGGEQCVVPDRVEACAWRILIAESMPPAYGRPDGEMQRVACGSLSDADRDAARAQAVILRAEVSGRPRVPQRMEATAVQEMLERHRQPA